jgi:HAD superfamily hydrolase (TIGR01459 family)
MNVGVNEMPERRAIGKTESCRCGAPVGRRATIEPAGGLTPIWAFAKYGGRRNAARQGRQRRRAEMDFAPRRVSGLGEIAARYDLILCDVWGVVHNGIAAHPAAVDALGRFRAAGGAVVLVTNAPRQRRSVLRQLAQLGAGADAFDTVVTSGDVTRDLIAKAPKKLFHLGPEKDRNLFEGIDCELVDETQAEAVVCSGLFDDHTETPADYAEMLARFRARDLPLISANPDIVVEMGDRLVFCAGALARDYAALGGRTQTAGKPHRPIYEAAVALAQGVASRKFAKDRMLAIGDGLPTDIAGAAAFGIDALYVAAGIHAAEQGGDNPEAASLSRFLGANGAKPAWWLPRLQW